MTTGKFLMALERFIVRRGHPQYTHNAKTFQAENLELSDVWYAVLLLDQARCGLEDYRTTSGLMERLVGWDVGYYEALPS
jgi:hypothetical protein